MMPMHAQSSVITYRNPLKHEIHLTQQLFNNIIEHSFPMLPQAAINSYKKNWTLDQLEEKINAEKGVFLFAWQESHPIGLVYGTLPEGSIATIIWLLVKEEFRNQAIGKILFEQACDYYRQRNCHKIKLTAPSEKAKNFYIKLGMIEEGFHENHWWNVDFWSLAYFL